MNTIKKPTVYLETSTISYLASRPATDPIRKAKQILTHRWWEQSDKFDLFISQMVVDEIKLGDKKASQMRLQLVRGISRLEIDVRIGQLTQSLLHSGAIPMKSEADATHVAFAAVHGMDVLLTWNQKHIALPSKRHQAEEMIRGFGLIPPLLITPEEHLLLLGK